MNSTVMHERPGVYSSYDASSAISGGTAKKVIGVAARAAKGEANRAVRITSYTAGVSAFGEDNESSAMEGLLRLLYQNGAAVVAAVAVAAPADKQDYEAAFAALSAQEDVSVVVCDSADTEVLQALRDSVTAASGARRERIAVAGSEEETVSAMIEQAEALNSERVVLLGGRALDSGGEMLSGPAAAAAVAAVIAATADPAIPLNGAPLEGISGVAADFSDDEIDLLVRGGVTPLEGNAGIASPVRGVTTRTTTGGASDSTWRELSTVLIVDNVIPQIRSALRRTFNRAKNTAQTRSAVRSRVIVELENKRQAEIIDGYGDVTVRASEENATVCEEEFSFAVAHGLNQIYLTAHITI